MKTRERARHHRIGEQFESLWFSVLLAASLVVLYAGWIAYQWSRDRLVDFNIYYMAAIGFARGMDIYGWANEYSTANRLNWENLADSLGLQTDPAPYLYPPMTAQLALPLTYFTPRVAGMIWLVFTAVALILSAWLMSKMSTTSGGTAISMLLLLLYVPPLTTMHAGQVGGFLLLAVVVSMYGIYKNRDFVAGVAIAVGTMLKLIPLVLLLYLLWRRRWRAAIWAIIAIALLMLSAAVTFSFNIVPDYFRNFLTLGRTGTLFAMPPNQGLNGVWARLLQDVLSAPTIYRLYVISAALVIAATVLICWPMRPLPPYWHFEYALIVSSLQMITPYAWYHQLVLLYIPLVIVAERLWETKRWIWLGTVLVLLLLANIHGLAWHQFETNRWLTSFPFIFNVTLWVSLAIFIIDARRSQSSPQKQLVTAETAP